MTLQELKDQQVAGEVRGDDSDDIQPPSLAASLYGGNPSISFKDAERVWFGGRIENVELRPDTEFGTNNKKYYDRLQKKSVTEKFNAQGERNRNLWCRVYTLQTDLRDEEDPDDNGQRDMWINTVEQENAEREALQAFGKRHLPQVGGWFFMRANGTRKSKIKGYRDARLYDAVYTPAGHDRPALAE